jgi:peptide/nickel transport system substrate-binding protein
MEEVTMSSVKDNSELIEKLLSIQISRRKFLGVMSSAAAGGILAACATQGPATPRLGPGETTNIKATAVPTATKAPAAAEGVRSVTPAGTLRWMSAESFQSSWDPALHTMLATIHAEWNCFDRLFTVDQSTNQIVPMLALGYKVFSEGLELTLRQGVKFHEGQQFTAADVKFSIEHLSDPATPHGSFYPGQVLVEVVDDYTVRLLTDKPLPVLNHMTMSPILSSGDSLDKIKTKQNGTGPFKWVKYEGETLYYEANMEYWKGPPRLKELVMPYAGDPSTRLAALQKGEVDVIERVPGDHVATIEADPNLVVDKTLTVEQTVCCFKTTTEWMSNKLLRQAVAHCVNSKAIVDSIMLGFAGVPESHISPMSWPFGAPSPNMPKYDLEAAKAKLAEAGFPGGEGLPELTGLVVTGFYANMPEYTQYIAAECEKVGIKLKCVVKEIGAWADQIYQEKSCDIGFHGWMPPSQEPDTVIRSLNYGPGRLNFINDPTINASLDKEAAAQSLDERKKILVEETLPALADTCANHPIVTSMAISGLSRKVKNYATRPTSNYDLWDVYLEA